MATTATDGGTNKWVLVLGFGLIQQIRLEEQDQPVGNLLVQVFLVQTQV